MTHIENDNYPFYFIAYNDGVTPAIVHFGEIKEGQVVETGQPKHEVFEDETAWINRINELKGIDNWYEDNEV